MELPNIDPARATEELFSDILSYIERAEQLVDARQPMSLGGLDTTVEALCKRIVALEPKQSAEYAPELEHLMERLTHLQDRMVALRGEVATTIKSLNTHAKAARAYIVNKPEE